MARRDRLAAHDLLQRIQHVAPAKRWIAGQEGIQHRTQAVNVRPRRQHLLRRRLLRCHVFRRAHDGPGLRQLGAALDTLGQAEVGDVRLALLVQQNVARLQVAMKQLPLVRVMHRPRHRGQKLCRFPWIVLEAIESVVQAAALHQLHAEEMLAVMLADFIDGHNVGMIEVARGLGFLVEAAHVLRAGQLPSQDHLQGHGTVETDLTRAVDDAHTSTGNLGLQFVVAEVANRFQRRNGRLAQNQRVRVGPGWGGCEDFLTQRSGDAVEAALGSEELGKIVGQVGVTC